MFFHLNKLRYLRLKSPSILVVILLDPGKTKKQTELKQGIGVRGLVIPRSSDVVWSGDSQCQFRSPFSVWKQRHREFFKTLNGINIINSSMQVGPWSFNILFVWTHCLKYGYRSLQRSLFPLYRTLPYKIYI